MTDSIMEKAVNAGNEKLEEIKKKKFQLPHWQRLYIVFAGLAVLVVMIVAILPEDPWYLKAFNIVYKPDPWYIKSWHGFQQMVHWPWF